MLTPEKAVAMKVAADLTVAACAARGIPVGAMVIDPTNQDPVQRNLDLQVWEIYRSYYLGVVAAAGDDVDFPPPASPPTARSANALPGPVAQAIQLPAVSAALSANSALTPLLTALAGVGVNLLTQVAAQIPGPGMPATVPANASATSGS
jgi:hypothetical protein